MLSKYVVYEFVIKDNCLYKDFVMLRQKFIQGLATKRPKTFAFA